MHHEDSKGVTSRGVPWAPVIAAALLLSTGGAHAAAPWFGGETPSLAPMLEKVMPAVVNVATEGKVRMGRNPLLD
ncbi:MAG: serine endoprotease DegQ, partial [Gammaproteobacteria bacterium]